ncbi:MAG TPA: accessory factor UbiK family protein [Thiohalobacter sp.]|nr:accessory factor UbiK family protein [Thiohalobacter sp.]
MPDPKLLDEIAQRLSQAMPAGVKSLQSDLDKNLRGALASALERLDLVTREEFEVQAAVLARTREKLDAMHARVVELERQVLRKRPQDTAADGSSEDMDGG